VSLLPRVRKREAHFFSSIDDKISAAYLPLSMPLWSSHLDVQRSARHIRIMESGDSDLESNGDSIEDADRPAMDSLKDGLNQAMVATLESNGDSMEEGDRPALDSLQDGLNQAMVATLELRLELATLHGSKVWSRRQPVARPST
jgi:hypothetical protein